MSLDKLSQRTGTLSAFGEQAITAKIPQVQIKFPYNINAEIVQSLTNHSSSTVTESGGACTVTCAGVASSFSQIRSLDVIRYGPGQGALFLGTCAFTTGIANSSQVFGPGDDDEGFFWGYNGTAFGVLRRYGGELEIRSLTITSGADAGGGDFVITMDGDAVTVTVSADDTIAEVCAAIVALTDEFGDAGRGWEVHTDDNITIEFISLVSENAAGTFSFSDTDSGVTAGTFTQGTTSILGIAPTETWIAQSAFNRDTLDGTGPSGMTLDPTKLNVYCIQYQYLGAGSILFGIESPATGMFISAHIIEYAGTATVPTLVNPTLHLTMIAKTESGYSGGAITMKSSSMGGFIEGVETLLGVRRSVSNAKTTTGTTPINVLTIHNELDWQNKRNKIFVYPDYLTIASEASKTVTVRILLNPTQVDGTVSYTSLDVNATPTEYDTAGTTVVGGDEVLVFTLSGAESREINLKPLNLFLRPGDRWVITASLSSGNNAPVTVGVTWLDRV